MATIKQKRAFKEVLKGSTISGAMIKAGYSATTASTTGKLTNTLGWKELLQEELPDGLLAKRHRELLDKRDEHIWYEKKKTDDGKETTEAHRIDLGPEVQAVTKGLDMAYKIKGSYAAEKHLNVNVELQATPEMKALADQLNALHGTTSK